MHPLSQAIQGMTYTIKWMFGLPEALDKMYEFQLKEGSVIKVIHKYRDSLIIGTANKRIAIGYEVAERIQV